MEKFSKPLRVDCRSIALGYRRGVKGSLTIKRSDYGISRNLGPAAENMELGLFVEGIRQQ